MPVFASFQRFIFQNSLSDALHSFLIKMDVVNRVESHDKNFIGDE